MNKWLRLVGENGKEGPGDGEASREVTFGGGKCVGGSSAFEEEQCEEDKEFGPNASRLGVRGAECFEDGKDDENGGPPVIEGEWEVDEELVIGGLGCVIFFDDIVYVGHRSANKQGKNKCKDVVFPGPKIDVDGVQDDEKGETPGDTIDDDPFSSIAELVDDRTQEKKVNQRPDEERPRSRSNVGDFFGVIITIITSCDVVNVGTEKEEIA